ncbi:S-adenosyl-L-methionine-dependent methyltransferase [Podospora aff. communis PSN243]|uniref:S-adenosyl-L-methionine-dependent methyltransferase n=1 Tax=Podospora aff. communis PSN243 TaxID=3040156 RepID=A0AAV9GI64_9PEZI|nr:S-adenosyl-L-methionine-dependent methyltransferase [Podospora aff. communis PSN243]
MEPGSTTQRRPKSTKNTCPASPSPSAPSSRLPKNARRPDAKMEGTPSNTDDSSLTDLGGIGETPNTSLRPIPSIDQENFCEGRQYHHYRPGRYLLPNDQVEQDREEVKHFMLLELTDGAHFLAPINPAKVLDLGTGTGTWAVEVADRFPAAAVTGTDLSLIQPDWSPQNVKFFIDDIEDEWVSGDNFDLIHARHVFPFIKDPATLTRRAFEHLAPGGWLELQDLGHLVCCDDDTMTPDYPIAQFFDRITEAWGSFGADLRAGPKLEAMFRSAGFINVETKTFKIPIGAWPHNTKGRELGLSFRVVIGMALTALCGAIATVEGWSEEERNALTERCNEALKDSGVHAYMHCYFVIGQKPEA